MINSELGHVKTLEEFHSEITRQQQEVTSGGSNKKSSHSINKTNKQKRVNKFDKTKKKR